MNGPTAVGTVAGLWRYPVKSMQGEVLDAADIGDAGTVGDRAFAVVDTATGKVASAKQPRKWSALLDCAAAFVEPPSPGASLPPVSITFPDGAVARSDDSGIDAALSALLERDVTLAAVAPPERTMEEFWPDVADLAPADFIAQTASTDAAPGESVSDIPLGLAAPPGTFFDLAVLHVLTTATLDQLSALYPAGRFEPRRYRPNILVDVAGAGFAENDWPGRTLRFGADAEIMVSMPTMRCVMTTLAQGDLPRDLEVLRTVAKNNRREIPGFGHWACAGAYAAVSAPGAVRVGDEVAAVDNG